MRINSSVIGKGEQVAHRWKTFEKALERSYQRLALTLPIRSDDMCCLLT